MPSLKVAFERDRDLALSAVASFNARGLIEEAVESFRAWRPDKNLLSKELAPLHAKASEHVAAKRMDEKEEKKSNVEVDNRGSAWLRGSVLLISILCCEFLHDDILIPVPEQLVPRPEEAPLLPHPGQGTCKEEVRLRLLRQARPLADWTRGVHLKVKEPGQLGGLPVEGGQAAVHRPASGMVSGQPRCKGSRRPLQGAARRPSSRSRTVLVFSSLQYNVVPSHVAMDVSDVRSRDNKRSSLHRARCTRHSSA